MHKDDLEQSPADKAGTRRPRQEGAEAEVSAGTHPLGAARDDRAPASGCCAGMLNEWIGKADLWFATHRRLALFLALLLIAIVSLSVRFFWSQPIHMGGDAFYKWGLVRRAAENLAFPIDATHHGMRWSIMLPVYLIQLAFGDAPENYYIWPFASSTLLACFAFLLLERMSNWRWGLLAAFMFITYNGMAFSGSQFLPMGPAAMYLVAALYCLAHHIQERSQWALLACAALLFCSYGAKITSIYYFPAFFLIIALSAADTPERRMARWKSLAVFLVALASLFMVETAVVQVTLHEPNRIAVLKDGIHGDKPTHHFYDNLDKAESYFAQNPYALPPYPRDINWIQLSVTPWEYSWNFLVYFDHNPRSLSFNLTIYVAFLLAIVTLVRRNSRLYLLSIPYLFGFLAHAYAIRGLNPFLRPERILGRYLLLLSLLAIAMIVAFTADMMKKRNTHAILRYALFGLVIVLAAKQAIETLTTLPGRSGYTVTVETAHEVAAARRNGQAIVVSASNYKNIWGYHQIFGNPEVVPDYLDLFFYVEDCPDYHFPAFRAGDTSIYDYQFAGRADKDWSNYLVIVEHNGNSDLNAAENYREISLQGQP
ncbi:hypothetical protein ACR42D_14030 [Desulfovibrio caledoniensis]